MMSLIIRFISIISALFTFVSHTQAGLLSPILNPLLDVSGSILSGQGIIQGVLGGLGGILGADQTYVRPGTRNSLLTVVANNTSFTDMTM
jgi:choline dehydrogenase